MIPSLCADRRRNHRAIWRLCSTSVAFGAKRKWAGSIPGWPGRKRPSADMEDGSCAVVVSAQVSASDLKEAPAAAETVGSDSYLTFCSGTKSVIQDLVVTAHLRCRNGRTAVWARASMADTDQNDSLDSANGWQDTGARENGIQIAVSANGDSGAPASFSETVWIFGETLPASQISPIDTVGAHQLGDGGDLALAAMVAVEAPSNLDHALDQLTTATDLFDVPVLDFHSS